MTITEIENEISDIDKVIEAKLHEIIKRIRAENVIPFCDRYKQRFSSGMGTFSFTTGTNTEYIDELTARSNPEWQSLYSILNEPVHFWNNYPIGSGMENYTPKGWKPSKIGLR